jgi:hypothetical protein
MNIAKIRDAVEYARDQLRDGDDLMAAALLAVLELHQPVPLATFLGDEPPVECLECIEAAGASASWPCATVLAIVKALGVDAAH